MGIFYIKSKGCRRIIRMKKCICLLVLLSLVSGISFAEEIDYGTPTDSKSIEMIKTVFEGILKDPESARFTYLEPKKCWIEKKSLFGSKREFSGYIIEVWVNCKNSFGGYTGKELYQFLFKNGKIHVIYADDVGLKFYPYIQEFSEYSHILHIEE